MVAVKKDVLQEYADILTQSGLSPVFTLGALARGALAPRSLMSQAVLDIGRSHSELVSYENGVPGTIRIVRWGGDDVTHAIVLCRPSGVKQDRPGRQCSPTRPLT